MKKSLAFLIVICVLGLMMSVGYADWREKVNFSGNYGYNSPAFWCYNPSSIIQVTGKLSDVVTSINLRGQSVLYLIVEKDMDLFIAHVGPSYYYSKIKPMINIGDIITIEGYDASDIFLTMKVTKGLESWSFRNMDGTPKWSSRGR